MNMRTSKSKIQGSVSRRIKLLQQLYKRRQYAEVIRQANKMLRSYPFNVPALVIKARAIQVLDDNALTKRYTLQAAKEALLFARAADHQSVDALNELAFYTYAVEDNSRTALTLFDESIAVSVENLREAFAGRIRCLVDLKLLSENKADRDFKKIGTLLDRFGGRKRRLAPRRKGTIPLLD